MRRLPRRRRSANRPDAGRRAAADASVLQNLPAPKPVHAARRRLGPAGRLRQAAAIALRAPEIPPTFPDLRRQRWAPLVGLTTTTTTGHDFADAPARTRSSTTTPS